ncbi:unnamed protein product [Pedinophyceae sp. YPF-701]|nr:unnamed protein product [Pedinophyceae sp. YPF-701]
MRRHHRTAWNAAPALSACSSCRPSDRVTPRRIAYVRARVNEAHVFVLSSLSIICGPALVITARLHSHLMVQAANAEEKTAIASAALSERDGNVRASAGDSFPPLPAAKVEESGRKVHSLASSPHRSAACVGNVSASQPHFERPTELSKSLNADEFHDAVEEMGSAAATPRAPPPPHTSAAEGAASDHGQAAAGRSFDAKIEGQFVDQQKRLAQLSALCRQQQETIKRMRAHEARQQTDMATRMKAKEAECRQAQQECATAKAQLQDLHARYQEMKRRYTASIGNEAKWQGQIDAFEQSARAAFEQACKERDNVAKQLADAQLSIEELQREIVQRERAATVWAQERQAAQAKLQELQGLQCANQEQKARMDELVRRGTQAEMKAQEAQAKVSELTRALGDYTGENRRLSKELMEKSAQNEELMRYCEQLMEQVRQSS